MLFKLYKEYYDAEETRKEKLNNKISIVMLFVSLYVTGMSYSLNILGLKQIKQYPNYIVFSKIFLGVSLALFIISLYFAIRAIYGYRYAYLSPKAIDAFYQRMIKYCNENYDLYFSSLGTKEEVIKRKFYDMLAKKYIICAEQNWKNNEKKIQKYTYFSFLVLASLTMVATVILIYYIKINK